MIETNASNVIGRITVVATDVQEKPAIQTVEKNQTVRKPAPRYRVLLHNDDFNGMEYVVQTLLQTVPSLTQPQAVDIMMEAHNSGVSLVITCAQEHAEFYCEALKTHGLTSTIEPEE